LKVARKRKRKKTLRGESRRPGRFNDRVWQKEISRFLTASERRSRRGGQGGEAASAKGGWKRFGGIPYLQGQEDQAGENEGKEERRRNKNNERERSRS